MTGKVQRLAKAAQVLLDVDTGCGCCADYDAVRMAKGEVREALKAFAPKEKCALATSVGHGGPIGKETGLCANHRTDADAAQRVFGNRSGAP